MPVKKIDISMYCNHKLIYKKIPDKKSYGLDNICILEHDFLRENSTDKRGIISNYCLGDYDNIMCDGQRLAIDSKVKKWHFVGFAYWGDANEIIKVIFEDNTEDWLEIVFIDWSHKFVHNFWNNNFAHDNKIENVRVAIATGDMIHLVYFHDCISNFHNDKVVKEIILPNNILTHIFALTIEY